PRPGEPIEIEVPKGNHQFIVRKSGFETKTQHFTVTENQRTTIQVHLEPRKPPGPLIATSGTAMANPIGMKFVRIEPGEFLMGSNDTQEALNSARPQHRVRITKPYYLETTEVTIGQFRRFVGSTGYVTDAERGNGGGGWNPVAGKLLDHSDP